MIQVHMNLQDPDSFSLQAHLGCETLGQRPGQREARRQESLDRGFLESRGAARLEFLEFTAYPARTWILPTFGVGKVHRVFNGRKNVGKD